MNHSTNAVPLRPNPEAPPPVYLAPDRFVTVSVYAAISGRTEKSIRRKMEDGKWLRAHAHGGAGTAACRA